jgi:hypothetical protein
MELDDLSSQLSYPGRSQSHSDRTLVRNYPAIFPNFYMLPTPGLDRSSLQELTEFLPMCHKRLRWLLVALYKRCSDILEVFRAWRRRRMELHPDMTGNSLRLYYSSDTSMHELVGFLRERMAEFGDAAVEALVTYEEVLARAIASAPTQPAGPPVSGRIASTNIPVRLPGIHVIELDCDIQSIVESLKMVAPLVLAPTHKYYRIDSSCAAESRLVEVTPLVARSLLLCDATHPVVEFSVVAGKFFVCRKELGSYGAMRLLSNLRDKGLIEIYRQESSDKNANTTKEDQSRWSLAVVGPN